MMGDRFVEAYVKASVEDVRGARRQGPLRQGALGRDQGVHRRLGPLRAAREPRARDRDRAAVAGGVRAADPRLPRGARLHPGRRRGLARRRPYTAQPEPFTRTYRVAMALCAPIAAWWGRMQVEGLEALPRSGPVLLAGNHDSQHGPDRGRRRGAQAPPGSRAREGNASGTSAGSARSSTGWARSRSCAARATPGRSTGRSRRCATASASASSPRARARWAATMRARGGIGRLAEAVPETKIVCVSVTGTVDYAQFPKRPRVSVRFFAPAGWRLPARRGSRRVRRAAARADPRRHPRAGERRGSQRLRRSASASGAPPAPGLGWRDRRQAPPPRLADPARRRARRRPRAPDAAADRLLGGRRQPARGGDRVRDRRLGAAERRPESTTRPRPGSST